ncbi:hypothetical protein L596_010607 [Steinernema carpocapsae]|uniref:Uncharacterized protein n=1 Tax=Steinernema carpocapsae TaxID=34508 RepID=A0A4U5PIZ2_STECR|nr:hypothetical protein L596_010607 [Steinernema carpocapsae]
MWMVMGEYRYVNYNQWQMSNVYRRRLIVVDTQPDHKKVPQKVQTDEEGNECLRPTNTVFTACPSSTR